MKYRVTRKEIKENYYRVLQTGYCGMQYLLMGKQAIGYNAGLYGWNFDLYDVNGIAITTGYRNMVGTYINPMEEEKQAENIWNDRSLSYADKLEKIDNLLMNVINKVGDSK